MLRAILAMHRSATAAAAILAVALLAAACEAASPSPAASAGASVAGPSGAPRETVSPGPSAPESGSTNPPLATGPEALHLERVVDGLEAPVGIANAGDGSGRLYVLEQAGRVRVIEANGDLRDEPFVDLRGRIVSGGERGLLGIAFHPDYARNRRVFVHYSRAGDGGTVVSELRASGDGRTADPGSERIILTQSQPFPNHNGGQLTFGPDGYLYLGLGDGGASGDPFDNAQNTEVLLGKILRLDVDGATDGNRGYAIPPDNPFAAQGVRPGDGRPEIWAYGLRNPWQFSFDAASGDLYIADVGQDDWEEVNRQPSDSRGGENYGWDVMEGRHCFVRQDCNQAGYVKPIAEYSHARGCSVTGGHVYRGQRQPELRGVYVFADYCRGLVFTLQVDEGTTTPKVVLDSGLNITAFGTDEAGEIYVADIGGGIRRVAAD